MSEGNKEPAGLRHPDRHPVEPRSGQATGPRSMTGFGDAEGLLLGRRALVQIRSSNHRYLDLRCRLPASLVSLERKVLALLKARLTRGKVDATISLWGPSSEEGLGVVVDEGLARAYCKGIESMAASLGLECDKPDLATLLLLPDLVRIEEPRAETDAQWPSLEAMLTRALDKLCSFRSVEGAALTTDLLLRADHLAVLLEQVRCRVPEVLERHMQRVRTRVQHLLEPSGAAIDEARLAQELTLLADRLDVEEEIVRFEHHLNSLRGLLGDGGREPMGRRLDFLLQELMRETNTLGAKVNDAEAADLVISMKTELERIREQVQNLE